MTSTGSPDTLDSSPPGVTPVTDLVPGPILTLHRNGARHAWFARRPWPAPYLDPTIDSWVVMDPADCEAILRMPELHAGTADIARAHDLLESRYGYSFGELDAIIPHVPLCAHGAEHLEIRRRMAKVVAKRRGATLADVDRKIEEALGELKPGTEVELMEALVAPLVRSIMSTLVGVRLDDETPTEKLGVVFDRLVGLRKRKAANEAASAVRLKLRESPDRRGRSDENENLLLALLVQGNDPLGGSIGESLYQLFRQNPGKRFSEIAYPAIPGETGVPYVERVAESVFEYGGSRFAAGTRFRVYLHSFAYADDGDPGRIFGAGQHSCLGKQISLETWRKLTAGLSRLPLRAEVVDYEIRTEDYLFNVPARIVIKVFA